MTRSAKEILAKIQAARAAGVGQDQVLRAMHESYRQAARVEKWTRPQLARALRQANELVDQVYEQIMLDGLETAGRKAGR